MVSSICSRPILNNGGIGETGKELERRNVRESKSATVSERDGDQVRSWRTAYVAQADEGLGTFRESEGLHTKQLPQV